MTPARLTIFRAFCVVALVAYGGVLCFYSLAPTGTPGTEIIGWLPGEDFMAHFVAYAILMALLAITVSTTGLSLPARTTLAGVLALGANGALELAQWMLPTRRMTLKDLLAGAAGALVVGLAWVGLHLLSKHARAPVSGGTIPGSGEGRPASEAEAEQS